MTDRDLNNGPYDTLIESLAAEGRRAHHPLHEASPHFPDDTVTAALIAMKRLGYKIDEVGDETIMTTAIKQAVARLPESRAAQLNHWFSQIVDLNRKTIWPDRGEMPAVEEVQRMGERRLTSSERFAAPYAAALEYRAFQIADVLSLHHKDAELQHTLHNKAATTLQVQASRSAAQGMQ